MSKGYNLINIYINMYVIKKDHEHEEMICHPKKTDSPEEKLPHSARRTERKRVKFAFSDDDAKQFIPGDSLTSSLQQSLEMVPNFLFEFMTQKRKQIESNVYTGVTEDQYDYLWRLFKGENKSKQSKWVKQEIKELGNYLVNLISADIMANGHIPPKKRKITKQELMFGKGNPEVVIKIRQRLLKQKISDLRVDMNQSQINKNNSSVSLDLVNPNFFDQNSPKTKKAEEFCKQMIKKKEEDRKEKERREEMKREKQKRDEQEKKQMELRIKNEKHQFLKQQYQEKRKLQKQIRTQEQKKNQQFIEYFKQFKKKKPLFKKNQQQFFKQHVLPENDKKLAILQKIKQEHQPISINELRQHQKQYLQVRQQNSYDRNAARMMDLKAQKTPPKYYKSRYHSEIQKEFKQEPIDPLEKKTEMYQKRWQYSTLIKTKFSPKISLEKRKQTDRKLQEKVIEEKKLRKLRANDYKIDGKNNLEKMHKYIAQLKAHGKAKQFNKSHTLQYTTKPQYKNYLRELQTSRSPKRYSLDLSSIDDTEYMTFELKKKQQGARRREQYLNNIRSMEMSTYMDEKKRLDEDFLESARAKMAILNQYE